MHKEATTVTRLATRTMKIVRRVKVRTKTPLWALIHEAVEKAYGNGATVGGTVDKKG